MEVDGTVEMFARSDTLYGKKYLSYIRDDGSKMYKTLVDSFLYGDHVLILKKECIKHV